MSAEAAKFKRSLEDQIDQLIANSINELVSNYKLEIHAEINERIDSIIKRTVKKAFTEVDLPESSIKKHMIDWNGFTVDVGQVKNLPNLDTVVYLDQNGNISAKGATVDALTVTQDVELPEEYVQKIKDDVIENVNNIFDGYVQKINERLSRTLTAGNLQQLDVPGEAALAGETLYASPGTKRVGINTIDPSHTFTVWDQETETVISKHSHNSVFIGTKRSNTVNIGAGGKIGITVDHDRVSINNLSLMGRVIAQADQIPGYAGNTGDIVLNNKPAPAGYVGWICIEHTRWAPWGKIG